MLNWICRNISSVYSVKSTRQFTEAAPHITEIGAIKRTSKEKLYNEQGLKALENRRSYSKLLLFKDFQIKMSKIPIQYYYHFCDYMQHQKYSKYSSIQSKAKFLSKLLFSFAVIEWSKLDLNVCNSESLNILKKTSVLQFHTFFWKHCFQFP